TMTRAPLDASLSPGRPITTRLQIERLEDRWLPSGVAAASPAIGYASDHILVRFKTSIAPAAAPWSTGLTSLGGGVYEVSLAAGVSVTQAVAAYQKNPLVSLAQPDYQLRASAIPNDPQFGNQWGLNNTGQEGHRPGSDIGAPAAWDITTGTGNTIVAVIDSG